MTPDARPAPRLPRLLRHRLVWGFSFALVLALSAFVVINASRAYSVAFGSIWFLAFLPAYLCALICFIGDPERTKPKSFYWSVPLVFGLIVVVGSAFILHEGVMCLVMLSPIWLAFGWLGAFLVRGNRVQKIDPDIFRSSIIFLPLLSGVIESQIPITPHAVTLTREIIVHATPAEIWPFAMQNRAISSDEGIWTVSQNIIGLPRPRATTVKGHGVGAVRTAYWGDYINFEEKITQWQPGKLLAWDFSFTNSTLQDYTDKHIAPDGQFLKIDSGDYTLTPLTPDTTRLTLTTNYIAKTHVNAYAELWGELFLGDVQNNILAILKARAEAVHAAHPQAATPPA